MEYKNLDELIEKAIKKDEQAFTILIHQIETELYKIAKIRLSDENDIYEAIQETIILIYKHLHKLKNKQYFKTWAIRILINECNKIYKKREKRIKKQVELNQNIQYNSDDFSKVNDEIDFKLSFKCLNYNENMILMLFYGSGYTSKEISEILKESEGTIKSRISRAKEKIKKYVKENKIYE